MSPPTDDRGRPRGTRRHRNRRLAVDTGLSYALGRPVLVRVRRRGRRYDIDDAGAAVSLGGKSDGWLELVDRVVAVEGFNVNRRGVIFVPLFEGRDLADLAMRLGETSRRVYLTLLERRAD